MQAICLQTCFSLDIREYQNDAKNIVIDETVRKEIMEETATRTDFSSLVSKCHRGPRTRGVERKEFVFADGTKGDVYRALLLAMSADPSLPMNRDAISRRIADVCVNDTPQMSSVYSACNQLANMALDMYPEQRVVEWEPDDKVLNIVDPYFLFHLRWSTRLSALAER